MPVEQPSRTATNQETVLRPAFHHVNLKTKDVGAIVDWYGAVVGVEPNFQTEDFAFLTNDAANHRVAVVRVGPEVPDGPAPIERVGIFHSAFEYETLADLLSTYKRLKAIGIVPEKCVDHGLTISFYYSDPDRNYVELQADAYGDWEQSTAFLRTDPRFVADSHGPLIDPDRMVEAFEAGADAAELHDRAYRGEFLPEA